MNPAAGVWLAAALGWSAGTVTVGRRMYHPWAARIMTRGDQGPQALTPYAQCVWAGITCTLGALTLLPVAALVALVMAPPRPRKPSPAAQRSIGDVVAENAELDRAIAAIKNEETTA